MCLVHLTLQLTNRTGLCPLGSCLHPFPRCASPGNLGQQRSRGISVRLANERKVSVSTHRQALAALLFFYGKVLCTDLPPLQEIGRPRPSRRLPVVLTPDEVVRILGFLEGEHRLFAQLLYGTGMRISEGFATAGQGSGFSITARSSCGGQGLQDRALMLPESLAPSLREQLSRARAWWLKDRAEGRSGVALPTPLSGSIRAPGIPAVVLGFCAAHAFDRSTERCRASPSHV